jgi:hypothetical protein
MTEIGMHVDSQLIIEGNHTLEGGEEACAKLLSLQPAAATHGRSLLERYDRHRRDAQELCGQSQRPQRALRDRL